MVSRGAEVQDWKFGLTDRERRPKPALWTVRAAFTEVPFSAKPALAARLRRRLHAQWLAHHPRHLRGFAETGLSQLRSHRRGRRFERPTPRSSRGSTAFGDQHFQIAAYGARRRAKKTARTG